MSGETEADVSGWTVDTLHLHMFRRIADRHEYYEQRFRDLDGLFSRRMEDADRAIQSALASAEKAKDKADSALEKRFEAVNEFRQALTDQTATFLTRKEYDAAHQALVDRVTVNAASMAALELRLTSRLDRGEGTQTGASTQRGESRANIGNYIAFGLLAVTLVTFILLYVAKK